MITVTTAATKFNLADLRVVRTALGISGKSQDAALTAYLDRASDVIARHCNRTFALEMVEQQFRLDRVQEELILSRYPVEEITSIVENGIALVETVDYELDYAKGIATRLCNDRKCLWPRFKIVVTYSAGYDLPTDAPEALQQACIELTKSYVLSAGRDPMTRSEAIENVDSVSYFQLADDQHLPPAVQGLLKQFRNFKA
jgi:hypothetical protein